MIVRLKLIGDVRRHARNDAAAAIIELLAGARVADLICALQIPADEALIVGVNGQLGSIDSTLVDGDEVMLVSPMAGGASPRPV